MQRESSAAPAAVRNLATALPGAVNGPSQRCQNTARAYLTLAELCEQSGLSESTIRRRVKDGSLPAFQPGGRRKRLLFPADVLQRPQTCPLTTLADSVATTDERGHQRASKPPAGPKPRWKSKLARNSKQNQS